MNTIYKAIIFFFCAAIALIGCGEVSGSEDLSSSSGQQENGVCYSPNPSKNNNISICFKFEAEYLVVNDAYCELLDLKTEHKYQLEWRSACPDKPELVCPLEEIDEMKPTIYLYGSDSRYLTCENFEGL